MNNLKTEIYGSARNNLSYNTSRLNLVKRDLEGAVLQGSTRCWKM